MIPNSWLKERSDTHNLNELLKREFLGFGLSAAAVDELFKQGPAPSFVKKWQVFIDQAVAGDEIWFYESPPEIWDNLAGRTGYALVRAGTIIDFISSRKS
jgi:hypothetical protein